MSQPIKTNLCDNTFDRELQSNFAVFTLLRVLIDIPTTSDGIECKSTLRWHSHLNPLQGSLIVM
jgi:hypothetical protein